MTDDEMKAAQARCDALPKGDWCHGPLGPRVVCSGDFGSTGPDYPDPPFFEPVCEIGGDDADGNPNPLAVAACDFIANARTDLPAALAEVRRIRWAEWPPPESGVAVVFTRDDHQDPAEFGVRFADADGGWVNCGCDDSTPTHWVDAEALR